MTVGTYTGTGASQSITGLGFSPDIVFVLSGGNADEPVHKSQRRGRPTNAFSFSGGAVHQLTSPRLERMDSPLATTPASTGRAPVSLRGVE